MKKIILLTVLVLLISLAYSFADVPCKINYQGRLIENNVPVDGTKTMKFSIYNSAVGGTLRWTSEDVSVEVHNGLFRYVLGEGFIGGSPVADLSSINWTAGETLYLEVKVETDILTPREELYAYPYAINSHLLEGEAKEYFINTSGEEQTKQGNLNIMGNVGIGTPSPNEELEVSKSAGTRIRVSHTNTGGGRDAGFEIYGDQSAAQGVAAEFIHASNTGITTLGPKFSASELVLQTNATERVRIDNDGNVGIGTTSPGLKLDAKGNSGYPATSGSTQNGALRIEGSSNSVLDLGSSGVSPFGNWLQSTDKANLGIEYPLLLNPNGGNVGIGTPSPGAKLEVNGNIKWTPVVTTVKYDIPSDWNVRTYNLGKHSLCAISGIYGQAGEYNIDVRVYLSGGDWYLRTRSMMTSAVWVTFID